MTVQDFPELNLTGPCGIYCGACRHYLARSKDMLKDKKLKHGCQGCRIQDKNCAFIKKGCTLVRKGEVTFCYECDDFPCDNLKKLNERHIKDYQNDIISHLRNLREIGLEKWLDEMAEKYRCPQCGGQVCMMDDECYDCGNELF